MHGAGHVGTRRLRIDRPRRRRFAMTLVGGKSMPTSQADNIRVAAVDVITHRASLGNRCAPRFEGVDASRLASSEAGDIEAYLFEIDINEPGRRHRGLPTRDQSRGFIEHFRRLMAPYCTVDRLMTSTCARCRRRLSRLSLSFSNTANATLVNAHRSGVDIVVVMTRSRVSAISALKQLRWHLVMCVMGVAFDAR